MVLVVLVGIWSSGRFILQADRAHNLKWVIIGVAGGKLVAKGAGEVSPNSSSSHDLYAGVQGLVMTANPIWKTESESWNHGSVLPRTYRQGHREKTSGLYDQTCAILFTRRGSLTVTLGEGREGDCHCFSYCHLHHQSALESTILICFHNARDSVKRY